MSLLTAFVALLIAVGHSQAQYCVRANGGDALPSFIDPGSSGAPWIATNPIQAIIKSYQFHCCGKVGGWAAFVEPGGSRHTESYSIKFQIWRPAGNNSFVKIGENSFPLLTLAAASRIEEEVSNIEQLNFQPGDVVGYYLENKKQDGGMQFDVNFDVEELWYATGNSALQDESLLEVGSAGDLSVFTTLGPFISISITTTASNCPSTFTSTISRPTMITSGPGTSVNTIPVSTLILPSSTLMLPQVPSFTPLNIVNVESSVFLTPPTPSSTLPVRMLPSFYQLPQTTNFFTTKIRVTASSILDTVTTPPQRTPTPVATPAQPSAVNLGLYIGVSIGLLVLLMLLTATLVVLACGLKRRRKNKTQSGVLLISYKPTDTSNAVYETLSKMQARVSPECHYAVNPLTITRGLPTTTNCKNPAYGIVTETTENDYADIVEEMYTEEEAIRLTQLLKVAKQSFTDPVVGQNAAYGTVEESTFNHDPSVPYITVNNDDPSIPTRENQAYVTVNNESEQDTYDYVW